MHIVHMYAGNRFHIKLHDVQIWHIVFRIDSTSRRWYGVQWNRNKGRNCIRYAAKSSLWDENLVRDLFAVKSVGNTGVSGRVDGIAWHATVDDALAGQTGDIRNTLYGGAIDAVFLVVTCWSRIEDTASTWSVFSLCNIIIEDDDDSQLSRSWFVLTHSQESELRPMIGHASNPSGHRRSGEPVRLLFEYPELGHALLRVHLPLQTM